MKNCIFLNFIFYSIDLLFMFVSRFLIHLSTTGVAYGGNSTGNMSDNNRRFIYNSGPPECKIRIPDTLPSGVRNQCCNEY